LFPFSNENLAQWGIVFIKEREGVYMKRLQFGTHGDEKRKRKEKKRNRKEKNKRIKEKERNIKYLFPLFLFFFFFFKPSPFLSLP